ncbi:MAG: Serine acetyltransferase (EC [uncultured Thiotrichaceae bacterium]|uniref:serine O-acetyltransferase n=1 Tax=uncultured Thiotrichaceae bacterium TaxID=298394 RepID=A0A6S6S5K2_9GAMM|nr:MAG: Serine acetyltransferase (EC [uncultured Thiotrichaceae bacterium]
MMGLSIKYQDSMFNRIKEDVNCVFDRDPAARNIFEVLLTYPGVHAVVMHRLAHAMWNKKLKLLARLTSNVSRFITGIEIHPGAVLGRRFFIDHGMGVVIGETAEVGDDCTLYHGVTLGGTSWKAGKRHPTLENNVVVGAGAKILGPITVSANARIGSNAVVIKDVAVEATVVGIPGREVVQRAHVEKRRNAIAQKMGFDAYGASDDMDDPVANTMNRVLDHIHLMENRIDSLCDQVRELGGELDDAPLPNLDAGCFEKPSTKESKNKG